jgi:hypothetical protein
VRKALNELGPRARAMLVQVVSVVLQLVAPAARGQCKGLILQLLREAAIAGAWAEAKVSAAAAAAAR